MHPFQRHIVAAILMEALVRDGVSPADLLALKEKRKKKHGKLIPMAIVERIIRGFQSIAEDAALGEREARMPFPRLVEQAHATFQPPKGEKPLDCPDS